MRILAKCVIASLMTITLLPSCGAPYPAPLETAATAVPTSMAVATPTAVPTPTPTSTPTPTPTPTPDPWTTMRMEYVARLANYPDSIIDPGGVVRIPSGQYQVRWLDKHLLQVTINASRTQQAAAHAMEAMGCPASAVREDAEELDRAMREWRGDAYEYTFGDLEISVGHDHLIHIAFPPAKAELDCSIGDIPNPTPTPTPQPSESYPPTGWAAPGQAGDVVLYGGSIRAHVTLGPRGSCIGGPSCNNSFSLFVDGHEVVHLINKVGSVSFGHEEEYGPFTKTFTLDEGFLRPIRAESHGGMKWKVRFEHE